MSVQRRPGRRGPEPAPAPGRTEGGEPRAPANSLLEAYQRFAAREATKEASAQPAPVEPPAALAKSAKRLRKRLGKGAAPAVAVAKGYARYRELGGQLDLERWAVRVVSGE